MGSLTWRAAMQEALHGPDGFYRREDPAAHFSTAATIAPVLAIALTRLAHRIDAESIVDIGAGNGALLTHVHAIDPTLRLVGVDVRPRPPGLPAAAAWFETPVRDLGAFELDGLVVANEWLDTVPLDLAEEGRLLTVEGVPAGPVPAADAAWMRQWWPGGTAEIGRSRDEAWADLVARIGRGLAVAIDYGHQRADRPAAPTLTGYRDGRQVPPVPDGGCDVTAHVAVDSASAAGAAVTGRPGALLRQRDALQRLDLRRTPPPLALADSDPQRYVHLLAEASAVRHLSASGGFGDFWWIVQPVGAVHCSLLD